ncbi:GntR family transcriptional regulator [Arthrobacter sp. 35W]|uniref:GntR family transcriptional regulator n=1 Tax=Arthrobacter sp. 35W TaxID=1132441 RepID=UPI0006860F7B|nr:GntR family transcriptional regulator [Arthrobacter sp. 35W]
MNGRVDSAGAATGVLQRDSPVAVYQQMADVLTEQVSKLHAGSRFHTEEELIEDYGVSRTTVRKAIQTLVEKGLLVRRQGKGTFVTSQRPIQSLNRLAPFVESFTAAGITPVVSLLEFKWIEDGEAVPPQIVSDDNSFLMVRRSYLSEGKPYAVAEIYLPSSIGKYISRADVERHPIYQVIQDRTQHQLVHAEIVVTLQPPPEELVDLLDVRSFQLIPRLERTTFGPGGEALECTITHFHPAGFEIRADVATDAPSTYDYTFSTDKP